MPDYTKVICIKCYTVVCTEPFGKTCCRCKGIYFTVLSSKKEEKEEKERKKRKKNEALLPVRFKQSSRQSPWS